MPKSLADGHIKFTLLTTKPVDPKNPTEAELNDAAAINASGAVLASDFTWSATDSDKVNEKSLETTNNANAIGSSNFQAGATFFRYFDATTGQSHATEDEAFQAAKVKGTTLYGYVRENGKLATAPWAAGDEATYLEVITDNPQRPQNAGGYVKRRVPMEPQDGAEVTVAAVTP